jgi:hypothetical protein
MTEKSDPEIQPAFSASSQSTDRAAPGSGAPQQAESPAQSGDGALGDGQTQSIAETARAGFASNLESAKRTAQDLAEDQKTAGARKIGEVAEAVHGAAERLTPELPQLGQWTHTAADALEQAAASLRERSVGELLDSCTRFARSQPLAFFGAAALAGFAAARFIKSSAHQELGRSRSPHVHDVREGQAMRGEMP